MYKSKKLSRDYTPEPTQGEGRQGRIEEGRDEGEGREGRRVDFT